MKAIDHARVWGDITSTLRQKAAHAGLSGGPQSRVNSEVAVLRAAATFTEIVGAAYREAAERDGE